MERTGSAVWSGSLKEGKGTVSTQSGTLKDTQYSFAARFAEGVGTNPEELIAAAHAGCFTMAFSGQLTQAGFTAEKIETNRCNPGHDRNPCIILSRFRTGT